MRISGNLDIEGDVAAKGGDRYVPSGAVMYFARNTSPTGWLKCNGAAVSRTTYAALFSAIGTTFGVGDNSTTFNLPDLRGEFIRGWDDGRGVDGATGGTGARGFASSQSDMFKSHYHGIWSFAGGRTGATNNTIGVAGDSTDYGSLATGGIETRPRNIALLPCIKI